MLTCRCWSLRSALAIGISVSLDGEPNWAAASRFDDVKLHLYGKTVPSRGRRMGHMTAIGPHVDAALDRVISARDALLI